MPVQVIQDPGEVFEAIESGRPTIIHYWAPWMGPESPLRPLFEGESDRLSGAVEFYIVDSGFIHPEFSPDQMPLTALYNGGSTIDTAPFDPNAILDLIQRAG